MRNSTYLITNIRTKYFFLQGKTWWQTFRAWYVNLNGCVTISHHCRITAAKFNQMMLETNYYSTVASNGPWIVANPLPGLNLKITTLLEELNAILKKNCVNFSRVNFCKR